MPRRPAHRSHLFALGFGLVALAGNLRADYDAVADRLGEALSFSTADGAVRARVSGRLDLGAFHESRATADLRYTDGDDETLVAPVAHLFADVQLGPRLYAFAQVRADRGFDPGHGSPEVRLDEFSLRLSPVAGGNFSVEAGRFATVFGSWTQRHLAWEYPFVTPPPAQDTLVGLWDSKGAPVPDRPATWAHIRPPGEGAALAADQRNRIPVQWGPVYATGAALRAAGEHWNFAAEIKNAGLSSRPTTWDEDGDEVWSAPAFAARLGWSPSPAWHLGASWARGVYLAPRPESVLSGHDREDYVQTTLGADLTWEWRHFLVWGELIGSRFEVPGAGEADTLAAVLEGRYKLDARWAAALRVAWQSFRDIDTPVGPVPWGREVWRVEGGPVLRLAAQAQLKLQVGLRHEADAPGSWSPSAAAQLSLRF